MYSHFWMLRRVQRGYACFDAYSRICLAVAAQQMLLVCPWRMEWEGTMSGATSGFLSLGSPKSNTVEVFMGSLF